LEYVVRNIKVPLDEIDNIEKFIIKKIGYKKKCFTEYKILKESVDLRKKNQINIIYTILIKVDKKIKIKKDIDLYKKENYILKKGYKKIKERPVIVGFGPAGMFAGLVLAKNGYKPIIVERGEEVEKRKVKIYKHWDTGVLDTESNVQFGEGGAGTFSDGKLTTRINDFRCKLILEEFVKNGAPKEILYKAKPHIGTDKLINIVKNIRKKIIEYGGNIYFNSKMTSILKKNGSIVGIEINNDYIIYTEIVILSVGHSARDTFFELKKNSVDIIQKPFSMGVRIEHPQNFINRIQFGEQYKNKFLGKASYQLFRKIGNRTVYSFCMCPGGLVVAAASENKSIVTNGMSEYSRNRENANSALVVTVDENDFLTKNDPLAGIEFQRIWERKAYEIANNGAAPVQTLKDFIENRKTLKLGNIKPSYTGDVVLTDLHQCLPKFVSDNITLAIKYFNEVFNGYYMEDAVLTGVETRTSAPVRILRNEKFESNSLNGLYPTGEGAGYAGGIMSAAVDGIKVAESIIKEFYI
jgi:uncharacterized FAD-dependent dehydrogenase